MCKLLLTFGERQTNCKLQIEARSCDFYYLIVVSSNADALKLLFVVPPALKESTATSFLCVCVPISLDNPHSSLSTVFMGTISSVTTRSNKVCQRIIYSNWDTVSRKIFCCRFLINVIFDAMSAS